MGIDAETAEYLGEDVKQMPLYVSHKKVRALEIEAIGDNVVTGGFTIRPKDKNYAPVEVDPAMLTRYRPVPGDFLVVYEDGYRSISPRKAFLEGYKPEADVQHAGLPVAGDRPQSAEAVALVNANKVGEEHLLRQMDVLKTKDVDQRWLAIARTHIEEGFMALNRAIFKPERVKLPEDQA